MCEKVNISSNHFFSNFFSKTVGFTKFLPKKCESIFLYYHTVRIQPKVHIAHCGKMVRLGQVVEVTNDQNVAKFFGTQNQSQNQHSAKEQEVLKTVDFTIFF